MPLQTRSSSMRVSYSTPPASGVMAFFISSISTVMRSPSSRTKFLSASFSHLCKHGLVYELRLGYIQLRLDLLHSFLGVRLELCHPFVANSILVIRANLELTFAMCLTKIEGRCRWL